MAAVSRVVAGRWRVVFDQVMGRVAGRFVRVEPRRRAARLVAGLLAELPRKNCWTIAEWAGESSPAGMQHLLSRAVWDADGVRDDVRSMVVERLGGPGGVLVVDETGDVKKGQRTVGVQRQYTGTAGRVENAQVAVYLTYAGGRGHAAIDRELYLPRCWTGDPGRCAAARVPTERRFATKPQLAAAMIDRAMDAGVPFGWVAGDEVYGNAALRAHLRCRGVAHVLAVACSHQVATGAGTTRADALATRLPARAWQCLSAAPGAKGHRYYDWALIDLAGDDGQLLLRRNRRTREIAYYRCWSPQPTTLGELVRVAATRWRVEEFFQTGKGLAGLDQHQVRTYTSWIRWVTLAMLAHAFLALTRAAEHDRTARPGLIALTCNEIAHLFNTATSTTTQAAGHHLAWSTWRRRHQARAQTSHYRRQAAHTT